MRDGDVFVTNAPYDGGTHLPDITVVTPVFVDGTRTFLRRRARPSCRYRRHHARLHAALLARHREEGALFDGIRMVRDGHFDEDAVRAVLAPGAHPARNPAQNIADLKAQAAACASGAAELRRACANYGADVVTAYMRHVQDNAEEACAASSAR